MIRDINAAGTNPIDSINYGVAVKGGDSYLVRFGADATSTTGKTDGAQVRFLAKAPGSIAAQVDVNGHFLFRVGSLGLHRVDNVANLPEYTTPGAVPASQDMTSTSTDYAQVTSGTAFVLDYGEETCGNDITTYVGDLQDTGETASYVFGVENGSPGYICIAEYEKNGVPVMGKAWRITVSGFSGVVPNMGALWTFENTVFAGANDGSGIYIIETGSENGMTLSGSGGQGSTRGGGTCTIRVVGMSAALAANDGLGCYNVRIPFATCGNKNADTAPSPNVVTDAECGSGYLFNPSSVRKVCSSVPCNLGTPGSGDHSLCCNTETTPPQIAAFNPTQGATNVAASSNIVITFNENVKAGSGNIVLTPDYSAAPVLQIAIGSSQVTFSSRRSTGTTVTIDPTGGLSNGIAGVEYTMTMAPGVVKDIQNNNFQGFSTGVYAFKTADITPPAVTAYSPAQGAVAVAATTAVVLTFSEPVQAGTGMVSISSNGGTQNMPVGGAQVAWDSARMTITPTTDLEYNEVQTVVWCNGCIVDGSGNQVPSSSFSFTTAADASAVAPTGTPTASPTSVPTAAPTASPTFDYGVTDAPTHSPTVAPTGDNRSHAP